MSEFQALFNETVFDGAQATFLVIEAETAQIEDLQVDTIDKLNNSNILLKADLIPETDNILSLGQTGNAFSSIVSTNLTATNITSDSVVEKTLNNGVTVDGVSLKDGLIADTAYGSGVLLSDANGVVTSGSVVAGNIDSELATANYVLTADGAGNSTWTDVSSASTINLTNGTAANNYLVFAENPTGDQSLKTNSGVRFDANAGTMFIDTITEQSANAGVTVESVLLKDGLIGASNYSTGVLHSDANGVVTSSTIVDADVNAGAAISYSKLNLTNSVTAGDIDSELSTANYVLKSNGAGAASWQPDSAGGDFSGPSSSTDNALIKFDGTSGKLGQNTGAILDDSNNLTANSFIGPLTGNADTATDATNAANIAVTDSDEAGTSYPLFSTALSGNNPAKASSTLTLKTLNLDPQLILGEGTLTHPLFICNGADQDYTGMNMQSTGLNRWSVRKNEDIESGSNAGSNFEINSFTDAGGILRTDLEINRATGTASFSGDVEQKIDTTTDTSCSVVLCENQTTTPQALKRDGDLSYDATANKLKVGSTLQLGDSATNGIQYSSSQLKFRFGGSDVFRAITTTAAECRQIAPILNTTYKLGLSGRKFTEFWVQDVHSETLRATDQPAIIMATSGTQSIANTTYSSITSWTTASYSKTGISETGGVFTVDGATYPGLYQFVLHIGFDNNSTGYRRVAIRNFPTTTTIYAQNNHETVNNALPYRDTLTHVMYLTASTGFQMAVAQQSGGNLDLLDAEVQIIRIH